jgi:sodium transport system permease protein
VSRLGARRAVSSAWIVFRKEWVDALRDRRTLMMVLLSSVAVGPIVLIALSVLVAGIEKRAEDRTVLASGIESAPTLRNYLLRQTYRIEAAPGDFELRLVTQQLGDPVLVVGKDFEVELARGEAPLVEIVSSSANHRAAQSVGRIAALLRGFANEQSALRLALRGVAPAVLDVVDLQERDLANPQSRAAQLTGMLPFFILMAVLYGALNAALDTTAGERERGSLEPLLMNPAPRHALVIGKWAAAASIGMLIALLSCLSFLPAQGLLRSETLAALFQFGVREAALFLLLLAPLAAALAAAMMAIAIRCKTFKEAQANNTVMVLGVSLLPLVGVFDQGGEQPWHLWVPALGQVALMNRVLKGEAVAALDVAIPFAVCALVAALGIALVARQLRTAAVR